MAASSCQNLKVANIFDDTSPDTSKNNLLPNQIVWAQLIKSEGFWPAIILDPTEWDETFFKSTNSGKKIWILWLGSRYDQMFSKVFVKNVYEFFSNFNRFFDPTRKKKSYAKGIQLALMVLNDKFKLHLDIEQMKSFDFSDFDAVECAVTVTDDVHWKKIISKKVYKEICPKNDENVPPKKRSAPEKSRRHTRYKVAEPSLFDIPLDDSTDAEEFSLNDAENFSSNEADDHSFNEADDGSLDEVDGYSNSHLTSTVVTHDSVSIEFIEFDIGI